MLADANGIPLAIVVTGANRHDVTQLGNVLDSVKVASPDAIQQFLYADKGYDGEPAQKIIYEKGYFPRVIRKRKEPGRPFKNRRWIIEVVHSWYNRFRKLLTRYEKYTSSYLALMHLASAIICWRKIGIIYG
mgnify:CR=1 FL=1